MKTKLTRLWSFLLGFVMVVGMLPATSLTAYAEEVYPDADQVSINEKAFNTTRLYYTNGAESAGSLADNPNWNAHYDPTTGILELNNFDDGYIRVGGVVKKDITIKLTGTNKITSTSQHGIWNSNGGDITITADSKATLEINVNNSETATGISAETGSAHATGSVTLQGYADVIVKAKTTGEYKYAYGIKGRVNASVIENASFKAICSGTNNAYGYGIYAEEGVTIDTNGTIDIDVTGFAGSTSTHCIGGISAHTLTKVGNGILKYPSAGVAIAPATSKFSESTHAINKDTINHVESYRYGEPYTVTVESGMADVYGLMNKTSAQFVKGDTVTVTANTISDLTFKKWTSADVTVASETSATTTFTMPEKAVTVTANYNLFTTEPSFTRTSDTQGTISFTLVALPTSNPKLVEKNSDTVVGDQYFYGSALERSNTVIDGSGAYNVPAGEYRIAVKYGDTWMYSDVFTVSYASTPQATVGNVTVSGKTNQALMNPVDVTIKLTSDTIQNVAKDDDVKSWFTNLPAGLTAVIYNVGSDAKNVTVRINGTPTEVKNEAMAITIPAEKLISGVALTVTENANAKYEISASKTLSSIAVTTAPAKTTYTAGENFDPTGMVVTATYSDTTKAAVTGYTVTDGTNLAAGKTFVTISYTEGGVTKTTTQAITVNASTPQATVGNVTVSGTTNQILMNPVDVTIKLESDTIKNVAKNDHVESWFTNLPAGLDAVIDNLGSDGKTVIVRINGTPTEVKNEAMAITIPGEKLTSGVALTVTENANAKFEISAAETYTVSFAANGGTGTMEDVTGVSGDYVLPANGFTAPNGKQFKAWSVGGVEKAAGDKITVNANTTVTAIWENIPVTYYTVTFDSNGGSAVTAQSIEAGHKATKPADPTKDGYDFKGWTLNGSAYDFNTAVNGNITLVATWEQQQVVPTTYTVSFAANGGTGTMEDVTGVSGDYVLPANGFTAPNGKQFKAWSVGGVEKTVGDKITVTANTTVTAVWEAIEYNVTVTDGTASVGAGTSITKATMGTTVTLTANAAPDGKVFDKWEVTGATVADETSSTTSFTMPANDVTAKATYKDAPHTHTLTKVDANNPTCTTDGNIEYYKCECGKWFNDAAGTTEITDHSSVIIAKHHTYKDIWSYDDTNHYHECEKGDDKKDVTTHTFTWVVDVEATTTSTGSKHEECTCGYKKAAVTIPMLPKIIEGDGQTVKLDGTTEATFVSDAKYEDFKGVEIDDTLISSDKYEAQSGSIKVTLKADYLATLSEGEHKIAILSNDKKAVGKFIVEKSASNPDSEPKPTPTPGTGNNTGSNTGSNTVIVPDTGVKGNADNTYIIVGMSLVCVSLVSHVVRKKYSK